MTNSMMVIYVLLNICAMYVSFLGWGVLIERFQLWRANRHKFAGFVKKDRLCTTNNQPHDWIQIRWREGEELGEVRACQACGYVPSKDAMVSEKMIPSMGVWYRSKLMLDAAKAQFIAEEDDAVQGLVRQLARDPSEANFSEFYKRALTTQDRLNEELERATERFHEAEAEKCNQSSS